MAISTLPTRSTLPTCMMTASPSHLLSLPREIRNVIYRYLSHEFRTRWRWNDWPISGNAGVATIALKNAPYTSVLLACSRLHDEYKEAEHFRNPQVTIVLSLDEMVKYINEDIVDREMNKQLLPKFKSVTVLLEKKGAGKIYDHSWFNVFVLSKEVAARSPLLEMINVVAHECGQLSNRTSTSQPAFALSNAGGPQPFFPCPYDHMAELPLRKQEESYYKMPYDDESFCHSNAGNTSGSGSHVIAKTGIWIFASDSVDALAWRIPEVNFQWRNENGQSEISHLKDLGARNCGKDVAKTRKAL